MYRLLIADDEALEREGLEWMISRMMPGVFEIYHAENGRMAIKQTEQFRPDIVLMDIQMPGINGLVALKQMKESHPAIKIVMVTAYDYFSYAKEALILGAKDYILKPGKREHTIGTLQRLVDELEFEDQKRESELRMTEKLLRVMPIVENELALMLMLDQVMHTSITEASEFLNISLERGSSIVISWAEQQIGRAGIKLLDSRKILHAVSNYMKSRMNCIVSPVIGKQITCFLLNDEDQIQVANKLVDYIGSQFNEAVIIGVGTLQSGVRGLKRSYLEAYSCCTQLDLDIHTQVRDYHTFSNQLKRGLALAVNHAEMTSTIDTMKTVREQQTIVVIEKAKQWIAQHYQEDLLMETVAEQVHLSPFYFSKMFKLHVGDTFIDYLTDIRIHKAKQFIEAGELSLKEICYEVGYKDPNYFSRVFKKITEMTPTEYKQQRI